MDFFAKQQSSGCLENEMNQKSKNTVKKKRWDFVGIFTYDFKCVSVWGCMRMLVWVIVAY